MDLIFRGWQGHFCGSCRWHLNTLVKGKYVVSTVGQYTGLSEDKWMTLGYDEDSFYETMVFYAGDDKWRDADVSRGELLTRHYSDEEAAQSGHYAICIEFSEKPE